jgi:hypothetical protein
MPRPDEFPNLQRGAVISDDGAYRYTLERTWADGPTLAVIGLNPSTADAEVDDMTIGRCMRFARHWGYSRLIMVNLFAFRASKPASMVQAQKLGQDVIGPDNDRWLAKEVREANATLAAWGAHKLAADRVSDVFCRLGALGMIAGLRPRLLALRLVGSKAPGHPLYCPSDLRPTPYWPEDIR